MTNLIRASAADSVVFEMDDEQVWLRFASLRQEIEYQEQYDGICIECQPTGWSSLEASMEVLAPRRTIDAIIENLKSLHVLHSYSVELSVSGAVLRFRLYVRYRDDRSANDALTALMRGEPLVLA